MAEPYSLFSFPSEFYDIFPIDNYKHSISKSDVVNKVQIRYLFNYLTDINCRHILVENNYVDHDYLDDYSTYYSKCFDDYNRFCKRAHFWREELPSKPFEQVIIENDQKTLQAIGDAYLGFTVIKPLPDAVVGRTVLRTYDDDGAKRFYTATKDYKVNLFGLQLCVPNSLAAQEQDSVSAACATTALWTAFHKTSDLYGSFVPTPTEITRSATKYIHNTRPIPTHGLNVEQMCCAISENRLVPEAYGVGVRTPVNSLIYSYLRAGIPVILGFKIQGSNDRHAVTISGYRLEDTPCTGAGDELTLSGSELTGRRISEFYSHDDNFGPFSRLYCEYSQADGRVFRREISLGGKSYSDICEPKVVIVPIYHKVRLRFQKVRATVEKFDRYLRALNVPSDETGIPLTFEWDIRVIELAELKQYILQSSTMDDSTKEQILLSNQARFNWLSTAKLYGHPVMSAISDATGMERSFLISKLVFHRPDFKFQIAKAVTDGDPNLNKARAVQLPSNFIRFIEQQILT